MGRMSAIQPESKSQNTLAAATNVVVGSTNPVKIAAVTAVLERSGSHALVRGLAVPSGVRDQPEGDAETIRGATQRATAALEASDADFAVGIEGGIVEEAGSMEKRALARCRTDTALVDAMARDSRRAGHRRRQKLNCAWSRRKRPF